MSEDFYLIKGDNEGDCQTVLEKINSQKDNESEVVVRGFDTQGSRTVEEGSLEVATANKALTLVQNDYTVCEISDCGDLCDGCSIRFYHNSIDEDEFFEHSQVSKLRKISKVC